MNFNQIIAKYRNIAFSERNKGDRFERLIKSYLETDPKYANRFEKIWFWQGFPYRDQFGNHDIGIDLVAKRKSFNMLDY